MPVLPKNTKVKDVLPLNRSVQNIKSSNRSVRNIVSSNSFIAGETVTYTTSTTIFSGQLMGILGLTYPNTFTFTTKRA